MTLVRVIWEVKEAEAASDELRDEWKVNKWGRNVRIILQFGQKGKEIWRIVEMEGLLVLFIYPERSWIFCLKF